ncbi:MAG: peptidoglycan DD-metalloendopeptidase family protein [Congregibacter sp.]
MSELRRFTAPFGHLKLALAFALSTFVSSLLLSPCAQAQQSADDAERTRLQIEELEAEIQAIVRAQQSRTREKNRLQGELRDTEVKLGELNKALKQSNTAIATTQSKIDSAAAEERQLEEAAAQQKTLVATELRETFKHGGDNHLKLLLNEDNPQDIARLLAYYRYLLKARSERLETYRKTIDDLVDARQTLLSERASLQSQKDQLAEQQKALEKTRQERNELLAEVDAQLENDARTLQTREAERAELETLLDEIEVAIAQLIPEEDVEAFEERRGKMRWPVEGRISQRFGQPRNLGKMRWQGVRLEAEAGSLVTAIHHGRVVYADWFRGSGLLLVLDHGDGYMSLYAHNETLLHEVGDWVSAEAPIATVGDSGGQSKAGLYFEIRKAGKPTDPQRWCRS